jgi:hypothetical protein
LPAKQIVHKEQNYDLSNDSQYGAAVWGNVTNTQLQKLQVMQNKFLRAAFNAPWFVRNAQLHREVNLPTIREYLHDANDDNHPNPIVRESVNYDVNVAVNVPPPTATMSAPPTGLN